MKTLAKTNGDLFPSVLNDFFDTDRFFGTDFLGNNLNFPATKWMPSVNITETPKDFKINLSAPGMKKSDFKINLENNILTIMAEKEEEKNTEDKRFTRREYSYGSFSRSFTLPEYVKSEKIDAKYEDGILELMIPKNEEEWKKSAAKEIAVK